MMNWFARLFGGARSVDRDAAAPASAAPAPASQAAQAHEALDAGDIDALFYRWLSGASAGQDAPAGTDKVILAELARLAASPGAGAGLVPRVPAVIPQLLQSLRDESVSGAELSRQLAQDVVLVAEVIREANSPYYRPATPIKTIEGAVMLLGQNGLRMLIARVAFRPIISMQTGQFAPLVAPAIWRQSEQCALAASQLAPGVRANPFEAYLAGLMQNVGLIVAFRLIDQIYSGTVLPQSDAFCAELFAQVRQLSARIGALWDFPVTVTAAIDNAGAGAASRAPLAQALALGDRVSKLRMLVDAGQLDGADPALLEGLDAHARTCFYKLQVPQD